MDADHGDGPARLDGAARNACSRGCQHEYGLGPIRRRYREPLAAFATAGLGSSVERGALRGTGPLGILPLHSCAPIRAVSRMQRAGRSGLWHLTMTAADTFPLYVFDHQRFRHLSRHQSEHVQ